MSNPSRTADSRVKGLSRGVANTGQVPSLAVTQAPSLSFPLLPLRSWPRPPGSEAGQVYVRRGRLPGARLDTFFPLPPSLRRITWLLRWKTPNKIWLLRNDGELFPPPPFFAFKKPTPPLPPQTPPNSKAKSEDRGETLEKQGVSATVILHLRTEFRN